MSDSLLTPAANNTDNALSALLIQLLKGVLYEEQHARLWPDLLRLQAAVRDYCRVIGLELYIDEAEGYAFLRQQEPEAEEDTEIPRLIPRRSLTFPVSLLLVLLRKRLAEEDASGGATRVVLSREQIVDMMILFMPEQKNEARTTEQINTAINRALDYGFLRKLKQDEGELLEIRRILKAFVDAQWLDQFQAHLDGYRQHLEADT
ncbi:DUF4194 domain-containing protein [Candidatus Thiothrix sp. Deng01]|uniref:DUF4194 domain-containing protein n=1 Tax=Candidatus Thiothrix phosphatis TaxID=3112415 RepID=A0ABU6CVY3_9GAMM|nr:DUF4194 domain-containing protein [Candidatus Thiothrix sp. Deng01]MEB4590945.1 DUF4194 domain-containing protein [Candidatus Thiothrix sp. Deng01]